MRVFVSWSGARSKAVAQALTEWLPLVIQAVDPWISTAIDKGTRGIDEISQALEATGLGIICLTRDNLESTWIHYEAGALAKSHERVWTFLLDISHADVRAPLSQFQHTLSNRDDVFALVSSINNQLQAAGERSLPIDTLRVAFDRFWPDLEDHLRKARQTPSGRVGPVRTDRDLLEEVLELVRHLRAGTVTIVRNNNLSFGNTQFDFLERIREKLGGAKYPKERLGSIMRLGSKDSGERLADELSSAGLVETIAVEGDAGLHTLYYATSESVEPKQVVEFAESITQDIAMSFPMSDRAIAALREANPAYEPPNLLQ